MTHSLTIELPDHVVAAFNMSEAEFDKEARFVLFAKLYEMGKISSGVAARHCGMGRVDFLLSLARVGVPMSNLRPEDLDQELKFANS
jgi:predicted HTH domain antitoxin